MTVFYGNVSLCYPLRGRRAKEKQHRDMNVQRMHMDVLYKFYFPNINPNLLIDWLPGEMKVSLESWE